MRAAFVLALGFALAGQDKLDLRDRWVYCSFNLWVDENVDKLDAIMRRAATSGYTGIMIADSKFGRLGEMDERYFRNVDRVKKLAVELRLDMIPAVFPIGYSESILSQDPDLAEALPVRDALFVVKGGAARCEPDPAVEFPSAWEKWDWRDDNVSIEKDAACMRGTRMRNCRIVKKLKVQPHRQYHVSVSIKSSRFSGDVRINVLATGKPLVHSNVGVKADQDWTEHHAVFNSFENEEISVYLGAWGEPKGELCWKSPRIEEVGLLNVVRRGGAPLIVKREDGTTLEEGKDFEKVVDPRMGTVPWKGGYEIWHEPPAIKTSLPDGTRLRVSYHHVVTIHDGQVTICPSERKTVELLRDHAKRVHAAWGAKAYFMSHDEIRVLNRDESCAKRKLDAGEILADNARTCVKILRELNPQGTIYVWSDMFDPNHNARQDYYLVRGSLKGSWEGLDKDVIIALWHAERRDDSMKFFSERGHRMMIAGYYDGSPEDIKPWLDSAKRSKGVTGVMYTTWQSKYDDLERFAEGLPK